MSFPSLTRRDTATEGSKLAKQYDSLEKVLRSLENRELLPETQTFINQQIMAINAFTDTDKALRKSLYKTRSRLLQKLEKAEKLVAKNHYRNLWMVLGMSAFGIPMGVAFGATLGNMGLLGIGLPIGMVIGMAVGAGMDKKVQQDGRQLDLEVER